MSLHKPERFQTKDFVQKNYLMMCLYELLLLQGGCAVLPQPHPEEAVVDDIAAIVLVDEFSIDQRLESKTHAAGGRQVVLHVRCLLRRRQINVSDCHPRASTGEFSGNGATDAAGTVACPSGASANGSVTLTLTSAGRFVALTLNVQQSSRRLYLGINGTSILPAWRWCCHSAGC